MGSLNTESNDVQSRLMQMLDSVRLDGDEAPPQPPQRQPSATTAVVNEVAAPAAPSGPIVKDPGGKLCSNCNVQSSWAASWCPECGFSPQMNRVVVDPADLREDDEEEAELTLGDLFASVPIWAYILVAGCLVELIGSIVLRVSVPDIYYRGITSLYILGIAGVVFGLSHLRAYFIAAQDTDKIAFASMFTAPVMIWSEAFKRLPKVQLTFLSGGWSLSMVFLAVLVIGLDWNGLFKPEQYANRPKFNPMKFLIQSAMSLANMQQKSGMAPQGGMGMMLEAAGATGGGGGLDLPSDAGGLEGAIGQFADVSGVAGFGDMAGGGGGGGPVPEGVGGIESSVNQMLPGGVTGSGGGSSPLGGDGFDPTKGGMSHQQSLLAKAEADAQGDDDSEENSSDTVSSNTSQNSKDGKGNILRQFPKSQRTEVPVDPNRPDRIEFVVIGYTTNASGDLRSLLLADMKGARPVRFKTRLQLSGTDADLVAKLEETLTELRSPRPAVRTPYSAKWVKPIVMCDIAYNGVTTSGSFNDGLVSNFYLLETTSASTTAATKR